MEGFNDPRLQNWGPFSWDDEAENEKAFLNEDIKVAAATKSSIGLRWLAQSPHEGKVEGSVPASSFAIFLPYCFNFYGVSIQIKNWGVKQY